MIPTTATTHSLARRTWRRVRDDWKYMAGSLFAAILVFSFLHRQVLDTRTYHIAVEPVAIEGEDTISAVSPQIVKVTLRGTRDSLQIDPTQYRIRVRPKKGQSTKEDLELRLRRSMFGAVDDPRRGLPDGFVSIVSFEPDSVTISFDREDSYNAPVDPPKLIGIPLVTNAVASVDMASFSNRTVRVRGPSEQIQKLRESNYHVSVEPIDVSKNSRTFERYVRVSIPPDLGVVADGGGEEGNDVEFLVRVILTDSVEETSEVHEVPLLLASGPDEPPNLMCDTRNVKVRLAGPRPLLANIPASDILAIVDCRGIGTDPAEAARERRVVVHLPPGHDAVRVSTDHEFVSVWAEPLPAPSPASDGNPPDASNGAEPPSGAAETLSSNGGGEDGAVEAAP